MIGQWGEADRLIIGSERERCCHLEVAGWVWWLCEYAGGGGGDWSI